MFGVELHLVARHIGKFGGIIGAANRDVGLHLLHLVQSHVAVELHIFLGRGVQQRARNGALARVNHRIAARFSGGAHNGDGQFGGHIGRFDEQVFARLQARRMLDQKLSELLESRVFHNSSRLP